MTKEELLQTYFYIEDISGSANTVYVTKYESSAPSITLYYSYDCTTWYSFTFSTTSFAISLPANSRVYLKGNNGYFSSRQYNYINCANNFKAGGNIMSLISGDNFKTSKTITNEFALAGVFYHGTRLIDASDLILPATNLSNNCYQSFFAYCSNLTTPPKILDCTTLSSECYRYMFGACSSLTTAPELPATDLIYGCYYEMFKNCSKLNYIKADFINYNSNNTYNWVSGVSSTGTFVMNPDANYIPDNIRGINGIPSGWNVENAIVEIPNYFYIEDISGSENTISITKGVSSAPTLNIEYSTDGVTWTTKTMNSGTTANTFTIPANGKLYLRGVNTQWCSTSGYDYYNKITATGNHNVGGNVMSLLYGSEFEGKEVFPTTNSYVLCGLFYGNTKLINAKDLLLPATTLTTHCYRNMFMNCSNLTSTPELPALTMVERCYSNMFLSCTKLTQPTVLPSTTLAPYCYNGMFAYCTSLTKAPELPATTLVNNCYVSMFSGCSNLNYIKADFTNMLSSALTQWVKSVYSTGTFVMNPNATWNSESYRGESGIPTGWNVENGIVEIPNYFYIEDISGSANTVSITKSYSTAPTLNIEYSTDGVTWTTKTMNSSTTANTFTIPANGKLYLRGVNDGWCDSGAQDKYNYITASGNHNVGGNIMSLLYGKNFQDKTSFPTTNAFVLCNLFYQNTTLVNAQDLQLPATTLAVRCYRYMFNGCTSLTTTPSILPATTLAGYCYTFMFYNCTSLTTTPSILPATKLSEYCYASMFKGCSSLNTTPELPATTLFEGCYDNMFYGCSSLTITPELPATTLGRYCYYHMFDGCTSLTTAPELPATTLVDSCYQYMFYGCSQLNYVCALFTSTPNTNNNTSSWLDGVSETGTFVKNVNATWDTENYRGVSGVPIGWNVYASNQRVINISSNNTNYGTISGSTSGIYNLGDTVTFTAIPVEKCEFIKWSDGSTELTRTIEITEDTPYFNEYTAIFKLPSNIYFINESENTNILKIIKSNKNLQYKIGNEDWVEITEKVKTIEFEDIVYIKGNNTTLNGVKFNNSEYTSVGGKLSALLYGEDVDLMGNIIPEDSINTFKGLFKNNTNLVDISKLELPENTTKGCYSYMFQGCTNLGINYTSTDNTILILPATELAPNCYQHMFTGCKSLKSIPELPANDLTNKCYHGMFMNCDGIDKVSLPEAYLAPYAYSNMFLGSDKLSDVTVTYNENVDETNYIGWLDDVSENGKFTYNHTEEVEEKLIRSNYYVPSTWGINYNDPNAITYFYIEDISGSENIVSITKYSVDSPTLNLEYSTDGITWNTATMNEDTTANTFTCPVNGKLYFRGVNDGWCDSNSNGNYNTITCSGQHNVGGNIMSLLYGSEFIGKTTFPTTNSFVFYALFCGNGTLVNAQDLQLPTTTLTNSCYASMFVGGKSLTIAPKLPATTLASYCYSNMFTNCTSLTTTPELPATTLADSCYYNMFQNCTSLITTPELPATTLTQGCYSRMFYGCSSLITAPELPATTLADSCYNGMFSSCSKLTTAPELPVTTLADSCYASMFSGCTNLTKAPELLATTLAYGCYTNMFPHCTSLTTAPELPATTLANGCYASMFSGCTNLTKAPELPATTLANRCYYGMFQSCSSLTKAPELPATTLADSCYSKMFSGCTNLTKAPELPATTLADSCYSYMFRYCNNLNYIKADFIDYSNNNGEFTNWVQGVSSTGTFVMNPNANYNSENIRGVNGIPEGWTVLTSEE